MTLYKGAMICCGTYALKNLFFCNIPAEIIEIASSVPFGITDIEDDFYHLLTPYCHLCIGIERACKKLKISINKYEFTEKSKVIDIIRKLKLGERAMIGPVNMGELQYIPGNRLYKKLDHYFVIERFEENTILLLDSEGILFYKKTLLELEQFLSCKCVEASEKFTIWLPGKRLENISVNEILIQSIKDATDNFLKAKDAGKGPKSFLNCFRTIKDIPFKDYYQLLLYDITYLLQRKNLLLILIKNTSSKNLQKIDKNIEEAVHNQINCLGKLGLKLRLGEPPKRDIFEYLYEQEEYITEYMEKRV